MRYRRFGRTEIQIPVISSGGMRFQGPFKSTDDVTNENQEGVNACVRHALEVGVNHFETARGYGTSEFQLGRILPTLPRDEIIVQTKVAPMADVEKFRETFETSMRLLQLDHIDLFGFHGINNAECLENTKKCYDLADQWRKEGRLRNIGFSTHAHRDDLIAAIETDLFDYVNLHWYYIFQDNWPAVEAANRHDMGVFIISPNDKGGMLYKETDVVRDLCAPLHPMVFNDLFCLARPQVHTLSCGVARPEDFDAHLETAAKLDDAEALSAPIAERLDARMADVLGADYAATWKQGLPRWEDTPGHINIPVILMLRNLALAFDMVEYGKMRYNLLGAGGHWFPGQNASTLDDHDLSECLQNSPHRDAIPGYLRETHELLAGEQRKRLQEE